MNVRDWTKPTRIEGKCWQFPPMPVPLKRMPIDCTPPGSSVTYRVDAPIQGFRVFAFSGQQEPDLQITSSVDGTEFVPCQVDQQTVSVQSGDYGFRRPLLLSGAAQPKEAIYLRIENAGHAETDVELSRVEIRWAGEPTQVSATGSARAIKQPGVGFIKGYTWGWDGGAGDYASPLARDSMRKLADMGCEWVCIAFATTMPTYDDPEFAWSTANPQMVTDDDLRSAIRLARECNLKVILKPTVNCRDGVWRAWIVLPIGDSRRICSRPAR